MFAIVHDIVRACVCDDCTRAIHECCVFVGFGVFVFRGGCGLARVLQTRTLKASAPQHQHHLKNIPKHWHR